MTLPVPAGTIVALPRSAQPTPVARPVSLTIPLIGVYQAHDTAGQEHREMVLDELVP